MTWIAEAGELLEIVQPVKGSRDPDDDKFLSVAVSGHAEYLISGDKDLLTLGRVGSVSIVSPAGFLAAVSG